MKESYCNIMVAKTALEHGNLLCCRTITTVHVNTELTTSKARCTRDIPRALERLYLDAYNAWMCELNTLLGEPYSDRMKRRMLFANFDDCSGVASFIQHCKDQYMTYDQSLRYLRENAHSIQKVLDSTSSSTHRAHTVESEPKTLAETRTLFNAINSESGNLLQTYHAFNTRAYRQSLQIPDLIWNELSSEYRGEINKICRREGNHRALQQAQFM